MLGSIIPAFRGVVSLIAQQCLLSAMNPYVNRQAANLNIGDVFKFTWPEFGIAQLVMRVVRISYGTLTDGRVRIECVEDIFGLPSASYVSPTPTSWVSPLTSPAPVPYRRLAEAPWWSVVKRLVGESATARAELDPQGGFLVACASRPSGDSLNVKLLTRQGSAAYAEVETMGFTPNATVTNAVLPTKWNSRSSHNRRLHKWAAAEKAVAVPPPMS